MTAEQFRQLIAQPSRRKATKAAKPRQKAAAKPAPIYEDELQEKVAEYIAKEYPSVMFDGNSKNFKLDKRQGALAKRMGKKRGYPDLFIATARHGKHGMYIELKREGERLKKKDGEWADEHVAEQAKVHEQLRSEGYWADFVIGYEPAVTIIKWYLGDGKCGQ
jgi:hypothetical protein